MSVAIGDAFDDRAWLFVTGYLLLQLGRSAFLSVALRGRPLGEHFVNNLVWELLAGVLWVAGAIVHGDARLVLWGLAVLTTYVGGWNLHWLPGRGRRIDLGHTETAGGHLVERFRLFFIILLGETVLLMGDAFTTRRSSSSACSRSRSASRGPSRSGGATSSAPRRSVQRRP
jgi:low temperature requirement protein LtrA